MKRSEKRTTRFDMSPAAIARRLEELRVLYRLAASLARVKSRQPAGEGQPGEPAAH
jgi:hypothetical protein